METRHSNGNVAELKAALYYCEKGYEIYWPSLTQSAVDFIAVKNSDVIRVQVKSAYWMTRPSGASYLQATTRKGSGTNQQYKNYTKDDCDVICVISEKSVWLIPVEKLNGMQTVNLERGNQKQRTSYADFNAINYKVA